VEPDQPEIEQARQLAAEARHATSMDTLQEMVNSLSQTTDKILVSVDTMIKDSALNRKVMVENTEVTRRTKRENKLLRTALILSAVLFVGGVVVVWRDRVETSCIKQWAVATSDRSSKLTKSSTDRTTDLYGALGAATGGSLKGVTPLPSHADQVDFIYAAKKRYPLLIAGTKADIAKQSAATLSTTYYLIVGLDTNNTYVNLAVANPVPDSPFGCSSF
jgi:hypothetical protein